MEEKREDEIHLGDFTERGISRIGYLEIRRGEPKTNQKRETVYPIFIPKSIIKGE